MARKPKATEGEGGYDPRQESNTALLALMGPAVRWGEDYQWERDYPPTGGVEPDEKAVLGMLEKLSSRQVTYALRRMRMTFKQAVAGMRSLEVDLARGWEMAPWWPVLLRREWDRLLGSKQQTFSVLVPGAQQRLMDEISGMYGAGRAHDAAVYVMDQAFGKAIATLPSGVPAPAGGAASGSASDVAGAMVEFIKMASVANQTLREEQYAKLGRGLPEPIDVEVVTHEQREQPDR